MKTPIRTISLTALALAGLSFSAMADDSYTVFRVCQDQHVLKTSDGADAGHIDYVVIDPGQQRIVSTIITGGVLGNRCISVPFADCQMGGQQEILLTGLTRDVIIAAPVIDVARFNTSSVIEASFIQRSSAYFGGNARAGGAPAQAVNGAENRGNAQPPPAPPRDERPNAQANVPANPPNPADTRRQPEARPAPREKSNAETRPPEGRTATDAQAQRPEESAPQKPENRNRGGTTAGEKRRTAPEARSEEQGTERNQGVKNAESERSTAPQEAPKRAQKGAAATEEKERSTESRSGEKSERKGPKDENR